MLKTNLFPDWDEQDEHQLMLDMMEREATYLKEKFHKNIQHKVDILLQQYPFLILNKTVHTMGITGSFFQGNAKETVEGLDGDTFILNLKLFRMKPLEEVAVNEWKSSGEYFQKIFFFPDQKIEEVKSYLDSII